MTKKKKGLDENQALILLHLAEGATLEDIKSAYRRLAMRYHPDRVESELEKKEAARDFQIIKQAYDVLMSTNPPSREKERPAPEIHTKTEEFVSNDPDDIMIGKKVDPLTDIPEPVMKKSMSPAFAIYVGVPVFILAVWIAIKLNHFTPFVSSLFNWSAPFWVGYCGSFAVLAYVLSFYKWELVGVEIGFLPIAAIGAAGTVLSLYMDYSYFFGYEFVVYILLLAALSSVIVWTVRKILREIPHNFALVLSIPAVLAGMQLAWLSEHSMQIPKKVKTESVRVLVKIARDADEDKRVRAIQMLEDLGISAQEALPFLRTAMLDKNYLIRSSANDAVHKIESAVNVKSLFDMVQKLKSEDPNIRSNAANALGEMGSFGKEAIPALTETLKDSDYQVSENAYKALRNIDRDEKVKSLPSLEDALKNGDEENRLEIVNKLIDVARVDELGIEALGEVLRMDPVEVRIHTIDALESLGKQSEKAVSLLVTSLKDHDKNVRKKGALSLLKLNRFVPETLPLCKIILKDSDVSVRIQVLRALGSIGESANSVVPEIAEALKDPDPHVQSIAVSALKKIDTRDARKALRAAN